jgi:hypothetical protein
MRRGIASHIGKATKRSRFGEERSLRAEGTQEATEFCIKARFDFHFVDSEWQRHYMTAQELQNILSLAEELESDLTTVMTVNARHLSAFDIARDYVEVASQHENAGLCFVAGNPSYLSEEERKFDAKSRIRELVLVSRTRLPSAPIFVGSEGLLELASELGAEYSAIPFMLLGGSIEDQLSKLRSNGIGDDIAVYCPCHLSSQTAGALIKSFGHYALRRKWVRGALRKQGVSVADVRAQISTGGPLGATATHVLMDAIRNLALCDGEQTHERLRTFSQMGVKYVAVLLAEENAEQNERLSELASEFLE